MSRSMAVVQCWDDGVTADVPLVAILRRHGAKATFNLNIGLHQATRQGGWEHKGTPVQRLSRDELVELYEGFSIANHSLTHPRLDRIPADEARRDIVEGRDGLEQLFQRPVRGFAYPFGSFNDAVMELLRETGHIYARTCRNVADVYPPEDPMAFHPNCHFLVEDFWRRYDAAKAAGCEVFYFWGHSYECIDAGMWAAFDTLISRISGDPDTHWADLADLFAHPA